MSEMKDYIREAEDDDLSQDESCHTTCNSEAQTEEFIAFEAHEHSGQNCYYRNYNISQFPISPLLRKPCSSCKAPL